MELLFVIFSLVAIGSANGLDCFGHDCNIQHQYCQIMIQNTNGLCTEHHGHGHHEDHQKCLGSHPEDHCFCHEQACVDEMKRRFAAQQTTTRIPTTPLPTPPPTPPPTSTLPPTPPTAPTMPATTTLGGPVPSCADTNSRCTEATYQQILCKSTNPDTIKFAVKTCPKSCNLCAEYLGAGKRSHYLNA